MACTYFQFYVNILHLGEKKSYLHKLQRKQWRKLLSDVRNQASQLVNSINHLGSLNALSINGETVALPNGDSEGPH